MSHYCLTNIRLFQLSEELHHQILLDQCQGTVMASGLVPAARFRKHQGLTLGRARSGRQICLIWLAASNRTA